MQLSLKFLVSAENEYDDSKQLINIITNRKIINPEKPTEF